VGDESGLERQLCSGRVEEVVARQEREGDDAPTFLIHTEEGEEEPPSHLGDDRDLEYRLRVQRLELVN
jgi:hypothetical protein